MGQEAYARSRREVFVKTDEVSTIFNKLTLFANSGDLDTPRQGENGESEVSEELLCLRLVKNSDPRILYILILSKYYFLIFNFNITSKQFSWC